MNEKKSNNVLNSLLDISQSSDLFIKCYLITRKTITNSTVASENRFFFDVFKVGLDKKMIEYFKLGTLNTLQKIINNENLEFVNYSVISDDGVDSILCYDGMERLEFHNVQEKINKDSSINVLKNLDSIKKDILAFCLKVSSKDASFTIYRKLTKSKVATDTPLSKYQKVQAFFDVNSAIMKVIPMQTVTFDEKIDFICTNKKVYIFSKLGFENIIGIEKEFVENAKSMFKVISDASIIDDMKVLEEITLSNKSLLRTVASIAQKRNHETLNSDTLKKYQKTLSEFEGTKLQEKKGKLVIENISDVKLLIKVLNDFYKQGIASGKYYGTNSGHIIARKSSST